MARYGRSVIASNIRAGDEFWQDAKLMWRALSNARRLDGGVGPVEVEVQYADGGLSQRLWDNPATLLYVLREEEKESDARGDEIGTGRNIVEAYANLHADPKDPRNLDARTRASSDARFVEDGS